MKKYALVKIPLEDDRRAVVSTKYILNYCNYGPYTKNLVYRYEDRKRKFKCVILYESDILELLKNPKFRVPETAVINPSSLESSSGEMNDGKSGIQNVKAARKITKRNLIKSKNQKTDEIIRLYKANRSSNNKDVHYNGSDPSDISEEDENAITSLSDPDKEADELTPYDDDDHDDDKEIEEQLNCLRNNGKIKKSPNLSDNRIAKKRKVTTEDSESEDDMFADDDEISNERHIEPVVVIKNLKDKKESNSSASSVSSSPTARPEKKISRTNTKTSQPPPPRQTPPSRHPILTGMKNLDSNPLVGRLLGDVQKKNKEISKLQGTVQQQQLIIASDRKKHRQQLQQQQLQQHQPPQQHGQQQQPQRYNPYHYLEHDTFWVGDNIYIPSTKSQEAFDAINPSRFIKTMALAIWSKETLSERVVRKQRNTGTREELTPRKKELLKIHYRDYLENRNYTPEIFNQENSGPRINKYLDGAIQEAKRQMKKTS